MSANPAELGGHRATRPLGDQCRSSSNIALGASVVNERNLAVLPRNRIEGSGELRRNHGERERSLVESGRRETGQREPIRNPGGTTRALWEEPKRNQSGTAERRNQVVPLPTKGETLLGASEEPQTTLTTGHASAGTQTLIRPNPEKEDPKGNQSGTVFGFQYPKFLTGTRLSCFRRWDVAKGDSQVTRITLVGQSPSSLFETRPTRRSLNQIDWPDACAMRVELRATHYASSPSDGLETRFVKSTQSSALPDSYCAEPVSFLTPEWSGDCGEL